MRHLRLCLLLFLLLVTFSQTEKVRADTPTPTSSPTPYIGGIYPTITPFITSVFPCGEDIVGLGTVTPSYDWRKNCGDCLLNPTATIAPTLMPTSTTNRIDCIGGGTGVVCDYDDNNYIRFRVLDTGDGLEGEKLGVFRLYGEDTRNIHVKVSNPGSYTVWWDLGSPSTKNFSFRIKDVLNNTLYNAGTVMTIIKYEGQTAHGTYISEFDYSSSSYAYNHNIGFTISSLTYANWNFTIEMWSDILPTQPTPTSTPQPIIQLEHVQASSGSYDLPDTNLINSAFTCEQRNQFSIYCSGGGVGSNSGNAGGYVAFTELANVINPLHSVSRIYYTYSLSGAGNISTWIDWGEGEQLLNIGSGLHEGYFEIPYYADSFIIKTQDGFQVGEKQSRYFGVMDLYLATSPENLGVPRVSDMCNQIDGGDGGGIDDIDNPIGDFIQPEPFTDCWTFTGLTIDLSLIGLGSLNIPPLSICTRKYMVGGINIFGYIVGFDFLISISVTALFVKWLRQM